jgi:hypothetical protein
MKQLDHSFCIHAYDDSLFIEECIHSLRNQTVKSDIYITTSTPSKFLRELSDKYEIQLFINSNKEGIASDWQFSYNSVDSKFLTLAHQDDIYLPEYTASFLNALKNQSDSLIAFSDYQELPGADIKNITLNILVKMVMLRLVFTFSSINSCFMKRLMLSFGNPIPCPGVMY